MLTSKAKDESIIDLSVYVDGDEVVQVDGAGGARLAVSLQRQQLEEAGGR